MSKLLIVYHTVYGNTAKAAEAIGNGIGEAGLEVELKNVKDVKPESVAPFDVIIIGSPTHRGDMSEEMKRFVTGLKTLVLRGKKAAAFDTRYVGEQVGAVAAIERSMKESGMEVIVTGLPVAVEGATGPIAKADLAKCKEFGRAVAGRLK